MIGRSPISLSGNVTSSRIGVLSSGYFNDEQRLVTEIGIQGFF